MKMSLLYALLAAAVLVLPAAAQQDAAPPAHHKDASAGGSKHAAQKGKLPVALKKGGAVVFQPDTAAAAKGEPKFKGYTDPKGAALEKHRQDGEAKWLEKGAVESLAAEEKAKAREYAAKAEMNEDLQDSVQAKAEEAKAKDAQGEEAKQAEAAQKVAQDEADDLSQKMARLESKAKKKLFTKHAQAKYKDGKPGAATEPGQPK